MGAKVNKKKSEVSTQVQEKSSQPIFASPLEKALYDVGQFLMEERQQKKISVENVAVQLCIRQDIVENIEKGVINDDTPIIYMIGFIRSYCRLLGVDAEELIRHIKKNISTVPKKSLEQFSSEPDTKKNLNPKPLILICSALAFLVLFFGVKKYFTTKTVNDDDQVIEQTLLPEENSISEPSVADTTSALMVPETPSQLSGIMPLSEIKGIEGLSILKTPETASAPSVTEEAKVILTATQECWIQIIDSDTKAVVLNKTLKAQETYELSSLKQVLLTVGNAGGIEIKIGDKSLPKMGQQGQVIKNYLFDPKAELEKLK